MLLHWIARRISDLIASHGSQTPLPAATIDAYSSLARALAQKLPIVADPSSALARLAVFAAPEELPSANGGGDLGYVRNRAVRGAFDTLTAPPWARGMATAHTAGPFVDEHGIPSWIDTVVPVPQQITVLRGVGGAPIVYLQPSSVTETNDPNGSTVTLGPGSLWIPAQLLQVDAPANGFGGIAFSSATISIPGGISASPSGDVYAVGTNVTLQMDLAPVAAPPATPGAANDGASAVAALPPKIHVAFAPDGANVTALEDAMMTVYGMQASFTGGPAAVSYDPDLAEIAVVFGTVSAPAEVTVAASASPTFTLRGTAPVARGSYRIPVAQTTANALGHASSGGALGLTLGAGMSGRWGQLDAAVPFTSTFLRVQTGILGVSARTAQQPFRDTYELWDARSAPGHQRAASLTLEGKRGTLVLETEDAGGESVIATNCGVSANIDRPVIANGNAPSLARIAALYALTHTTADTTLLVEGTVPAFFGIVEPPPQPAVSYVIENAVLRTSGVDALIAFAKLTSGRGMQGALYLGSELDRVIPILPDPYASNVDVNDEVVAEKLVATTVWTAPDTPRVAFAILRPAPSANAKVAPVGSVGADANLALSRGRAAIFEGLDALYDVSSAQSQFGVMLNRQALLQGQIVGQQLAVAGQQAFLFTVPAIAWEPVLDPARTFFSISEDDGPPGIVAVPTANLRPLEPGAFYDAFVADYRNGADLLAVLSLPFGLIASVDTRVDVNTQPPIARPDLVAIQPAFGDRLGGKQLSIQGKYDAVNDRTVLPGLSLADSDYAKRMLSDDAPAFIVATMWNEDFGGQPLPGAVSTHFVPVSRYDLSGYGASIFSDFQYHGDETGVTEARFDVMVGRTQYELVQVQSVILPWHIEVINTTIISRDANGYVNRVNTGWRAKTDGLFQYPGVDPNELELGGITGVFDVRNIVEGAEEVVAGKHYARVTFDADVQLVVDPANHGLKVTGGNDTGRIPSRSVTGYLIADAKDKPSVAEAVLVMSALGPATAPIAAEIDVDGTAIAMALSGVEVTLTRADVVHSATNPQTIAAALRGVPRLPRDGSWSIGTRPATSTVPQPVSPTTPVPLMRSNADAATWRIADAQDVVKFDDPLHFYGILQATGANKVFFEHPTIRNAAGANPLNFDKTPKLADVGKLLGDNGLLPDIVSLLDFGAFDGLAKSGDGFTLKKDLTQTVDLGKRTLIPLGPIRLQMASWNPGKVAKPSTITLHLDPSASPRWKIDIVNIAFNLVIDGWGNDDDPLITVHGDASAQEGGAPSFSNLAVQYGSALSVVKDILTAVEQVLAFLPDAAKKAGLDVSFQGSKLRIREAFPIPKLPLGLGYIEDISLDLGFDVDVLDKKLSFFVGLGDDRAPFHWLVSPLSGNGMLQLGASDRMGVKMQAGIGVGLAIDFAIVSGSASIVIAVQLDATSNPIGVMVLLTGQASVDVLDGLASASLTLTAGVGVKVSPGPLHDLTDIPPDPIDYLKQTTVTLMAEVAVGIHLSVCWLVHVDFDGSWPFSETVSGKTLAALV